MYIYNCINTITAIYNNNRNTDSTDFEKVKAYCSYEHSRNIHNKVWLSSSCAQ